MKDSAKDKCTHHFQNSSEYDIGYWEMTTPPPNAESFYLPPPTLRFFNPILSAKTFKLLLTGDKKTWRYDSNTQTSYPADYQQVKKHKWNQLKENKPYY